MDENYETLKIFCDKQKVMIADLLSKVLMLETQLEVLKASMRNDINKENPKEKKAPAAFNRK